MTGIADIPTKLGAARTRLILDRPFIGALVMHLPLVPAAAPRCETVATDARALYYNPAYIAGLTLTETQFVLAHEAMHCALGHFARRSHRVRRRWEIACDHAVNLLLVEEGLRPPEGVLANPDFKGLSAEEIYPLIPAEPVERTLDRHLFDEYGMDPRAGAVNRDGRAGEFGSSPSSDLPRDAVLEDSGELARRWQSRIVSAAQQARRAGRLAESWLRRVDGAIEPQLPWRALLARYLAGTARDDYSFQRPPRREGNALLPRLASGEVELCVTLDTSGSIGAEELAQFVSEVDAIKGQIRARVTLHACDERLDPRGPWEFQYWEPVTLPREIGGGGGTRFVPVFEWIESARRTPDVLLYFTDAEGEFPQHAPVFPVIWLVKGRGRVPWGARIQLN
ncbi:MAG TPA: VWA-like domain-containing protein [Burkholderiales bacterium]